MLRPLRLYLTHAKMTGYDASGELCAALTPVEKALRAEGLENERQENEAAAKIQARLRGKNARQQVESRAVEDALL